MEAMRESSEKLAHAAQLHQLIDAVSAGDLSTLDAVAVSAGPGSYTGLRVGSSAAKGICYALDLPLIALSTLECMALDFATEHPVNDEMLAPMLDARRMEVYLTLFDASGTRLQPDQAQVVDAYFLRETRGAIHIFGSGAAKCRELLPDRFVLHAGFEPHAKSMLAASFQAFRERRFADAAMFEPWYLKNFVGTQAKKMS